jgi:plastocyanin
MATLLGTALVGLFAAPTSAVGHSAAIVDVSSYTYAFSPSSITIHIGDRITWSNKSTAPHNVTFASFGSPYSMDSGSQYTHTFGTAGTFRYTCTIHGFGGKVVVVGAAATPRPTPKPTPKPTQKPTPKPTVRPTSTAASAPTVAGTPTTALPTTASAAVPSATEVESSSPAVAYGASGTPQPTTASDTTGPPVAILLGIVGVGIVALGVILVRRR